MQTVTDAVFGLAMAGKTRDDIMADLNIGYRTVSQYLTNLRRSGRLPSDFLLPLKPLDTKRVRPFTPEELTELWQFYLAGESHSLISEILGRTPQEISGVTTGVLHPDESRSALQEWLKSAIGWAKATQTRFTWPIRWPHHLVLP